MYKVRLDMGTRAVPAPVVLSDETFARMKQLGVLLRLPPESTGAEGAAVAVRALAEECLRALAPEAAPPGGPSEPG
jgi:hypothetical protein